MNTNNQYSKLTYTQVLNQQLTTYLADLPEHSWPEYLDQRVEVDGTMTHVWTASTQAFFPQIDVVPEAFNINKAESMQIEMCKPVVIIPPTTVGGVDGIVKIRAMGGHSHNFNYSITLEAGGAPIVNTTGIFTNIPVGSHDILITETLVGTNPIGSDYQENGGIVMPVGVGFGTRYHCIFENEHGRDVTVQILRAGYVGQSEEICLGGTPLVLSNDVIGDDFIGGIVPIEMNLDVLQTYDGQFGDMFRTNKEMWKLRVSDSTYLDITGTIMISESSIEHQDNPIHIQMTAYAGLTDLSEKEIKDWTGNITLLDVIVAVQAEYNILIREFEEFTGMYESADSAAFSPSMFSHYKVNAAMFNGKKPKEAVTDLLKSFGCAMYTTETDALRIHLIANSTLFGQTGLVGAKYNNGGIYQTSFVTDIGIIEIRGDKSGDAFYIERAQRYGFLDKVSKLSMQNNITELEGWKMSLDDTKWSLLDGGNANSVLSKGVDDDFLTLESAWTGNLLTQAVRGHVSMGSFRIYGSEMNLEANFKILLVDKDGFNGTEVIGDIASVLFTVGNAASMSDGVHLDKNIGMVMDVNFEKTNEWNEVKLENRTDDYDTPADGYNVRMWVYGVARKDFNTDDGTNVWSNEIQFKEGSVMVLLPEEHDEINEPYELDNGEDGIDLGIMSLSIGDAPAATSYSLNFGGVLARETFENTSKWKTIIDITERTLHEHMANNLMLLRGRDIKRLEGVLNAEYPMAGTVIFDATVDGGYFFLQKFTYDVKFNKLEFSGLEVNRVSDERIMEYVSTPNNRLLEDTERSERLLQ